MPIDSVIIDAIKQKADIAEVVSDHIKLEKQGQNYIGLCPFHDDSTPSLTVNTTKGIYKCFACGATGDVIDFLQKYLKITFPEAVKMLSDKYGIEMSGESTPHAAEAVQFKRQSMYMINSEAAKFFSENGIMSALGIGHDLVSLFIDHVHEPREPVEKNVLPVR